MSRRPGHAAIRSLTILGLLLTITALAIALRTA